MNKFEESRNLDTYAEEHSPEDPTELELVYEDLRKAEQRVAELEAEVGHYKEWLKERTSELQQRIAELEENASIAAHELSFTGDLQALQDAKERIAELERENERLKQYACQCEASVHSTQERIAELEEAYDIVQNHLVQECFKKAIRIVELEDLEKNFAACDKQRLEFHEHIAELEAERATDMNAVYRGQLEQRIVELEALVEHMRQWRLEAVKRIAELEAQLDFHSIQAAELLEKGKK